MRAIIAAAALLISTPCLLASTNPDAQQLLATARQQGDIFGDHGTPLELQIDFVAQLNVPTSRPFDCSMGCKESLVDQGLDERL
jgi:hypothetical protein